MNQPPTPVDGRSRRLPSRWPQSSNWSRDSNPLWTGDEAVLALAAVIAFWC